jgi:hypothetical protein
MLKKLAITLCLLFIAVGVLARNGAPQGTPKQGITKQETSKKGQEQPQAQSNNHPTPSAVPTAPQPAAPSCNEACQQGRENLKIQNRLALLTFGLVVVGAFQVGGMIWQAILIRQTRSDVHRQAEWMETQAGYMRDQTETLKDSVKAAQASADAASAQIQLMKNKERGRLRIEFDKPDLVHGPDPDNGYELPFRLILDGTTQVYITESSCFIGIHVSGDPVGDPWWNWLGVPKTITPEDRIYKGTATILTDEKPWGEPITGVDEARVALVREDKLHVFARGFVLYEDIFDGIWGVRFNLKWQYSTKFPSFDEVDLSSGWWASIGDNGEYKAEKQRPNPN